MKKIKIINKKSKDDPCLYVEKKGKEKAGKKKRKKKLPMP